MQTTRQRHYEECEGHTKNVKSMVQQVETKNMLLFDFTMEAA